MNPACKTSATPGPSVHTRAVITWVAIFPMVTVGMLVLAWCAPNWHPVLRSLVLTLVVVPLTVYFTVPGLLKLHAKIPNRAARDAIAPNGAEDILDTQVIG